MSDLIAWLRAQLDDDERVARAASAENGPTWYVGGERDVLADNPSDTPYVACGPWGGGIDAATADHIARHDPARVLAEVNAKRAILAIHHDDGHGDCAGCGLDPIGLAVHQIDECPTVLAMLQPYAGRPGWREEWRA